MISQIIRAILLTVITGLLVAVSVAIRETSLTLKGRI